MEKYESKQVRILSSAERIYAVASDFTNFTPIVSDRVEDWSATPDECGFRIKGFSLSLRIAEKEPPTTVKFISGDSSPISFTFWLQLREMTADDTRMKLTLHAELPVMIRMMIGGKLQQALDTMADRIAESFNNAAV